MSKMGGNILHHTLTADQLIYSMSSSHEPVLRVADGDVVEIHTCDCFENQIVREDQEFGELNWDRINPATGPIYIEGARPGDLLVVHILKMELAGHGVMTTGPRLGVMGKELTQNVIRILPVQNNEVVFSERLTLPLQPMIGVIGTAPDPAKGAVSCGTPGEHGGNMDCKRITTGAQLLLPVNVPGALFALGDLHAAMGDGEVAVCGVEIAGVVTVQLQVLKGKRWPAPLLIDETRVMTIASAKLLDDAAIEATKHMVQLLELECDLPTAEATLLLSAAGNLRICQIVDPLMTARMEVSRALLEQQGFSFSRE